MSDCIFCKMAEGMIRPDVVYETDRVLAFRDINPQAKVHVLVIPKQHIPTLDEFPSDHPDLAGDLFTAVREVARLEGLDRGGYRTVINCREDGGQEVFHLHLHVLGGRKMIWPPG
jgi:histidine triad (HIT) family protein